MDILWSYWNVQVHFTRISRTGWKIKKKKTSPFMQARAHTSKWLPSLNKQSGYLSSSSTCTPPKWYPDSWVILVWKTVARELVGPPWVSTNQVDGGREGLWMKWDISEKVRVIGFCLIWVKRKNQPRNRCKKRGCLYPTKKSWLNVILGESQWSWE